VQRTKEKVSCPVGQRKTLSERRFAKRRNHLKKTAKAWKNDRRGRGSGGGTA